MDRVPSSRPTMSESGYSLIELILVLVIGSAVLYIAKDQFFDTINLQTITREHNLWQSIEQDIRRSVLNDAMFKLAQERSKPLAACMKAGDGANCAAGSQPLTLYLSATRPVTGSYSSSGQSCSGKNCPIQIETEFIGLCKAGSVCDAAASVIVDYRIMVAGALYRQGSLQRSYESKEFNDDAESCPIDDLGRSGFANAINKGKLECQPAPRVTRKLSGVKPGDCINGEQVLTGFGPAGDPLCSALVRNTKP